MFFPSKNIPLFREQQMLRVRSYSKTRVKPYDTAFLNDTRLSPGSQESCAAHDMMSIATRRCMACHRPTMNFLQRNVTGLEVFPACDECEATVQKIMDQTPPPGSPKNDRRCDMCKATASMPCRNCRRPRFCSEHCLQLKFALEGASKCKLCE